MNASSQTNPSDTPIGWIGTGVMGASMCGHVLNAGYTVTLFTRTKSKAQPLLERGARWAASPRDVASQSRITFSIVGFPEDVEDVLLNPTTGALGGCRPGDILVDMTTSRPSLAVGIGDRAQQVQVRALDAPVSGGDVGAREARLSIMIGGEEDAVQLVMPIFELLGKTIVHQGPSGAGQHTKMVNQTLIATGMIGVCEALLYGYQAGLDLELVMQSVASGAAGSWSLSNYGPRILSGDFAPGFFVEHFVKDMGLALEEARRMRLSLPGLALAEQLYIALMAKGHGRSGTQALHLALAELSNLDWPAS